MKNNTIIKIEDIKYIKETLACAYAFIDNDLDAICDDDYKEEAESLLDNINNSLSIVDKYL